jgi:outer membrane protein TolC
VTRPSILAFCLTVAVAAPAAAQPPQTGPDLSLEAALSALPSSPAWRAADRSVEIAQRSLDAARGSALISLTIGGEYSTTGVSSTIPELAGSRTASGLNATAATAILPWSPALDAVRAAERGVTKAELERREARSGLVLDLTSRYLEASSSLASLELARSAEALAQRRREIAGVQLQAGTGTRDGVLSADQALASARGATRQAEAGAILARRSLLAALGRADGPIRLTTPVPALKAFETEDASLARALENRTDIQKATLAVLEAQDALEVAARDRWLPQASLTLSYGGIGADGQQTGSRLSGSLNINQGSFAVQGGLGLQGQPVAGSSLSFGANIALPVVAPGADGRVAAAEAGLEAARAGLENARITAELEVRRRWLEASVTRDGIPIAESGVTLADGRVADAEARLKLELISPLELDAARLAQAQAVRDLEAAKTNALLATLRLEASVGIITSVPQGGTP